MKSIDHQYLVSLETKDVAIIDLINETPESVSKDEYLSILVSLQQHHAIFYQLFELGQILFSDKTQTACITFDDSGNFVNFLFNYKFWKSLDNKSRLFIICHECLHIILNHGIRLVNTPITDLPIANIAADIVVNELLLCNFNFKLIELNNLSDNLCTVESVFGENDDYYTDASMEYYFNKLKQDCANVEFSSIDDHSILSGTTNQNESRNLPNLDKLSDILGDGLSQDEKDELKDIIRKHDQIKNSYGKRAGTGVGNWTNIYINKVSVKRKWETVIKKWSRKYDRPDFRDIEQWSRLNRRFNLANSDLLLPTEMEIEHETEGMINVFFFMDTSGSCWNLKERFFKAARSLPKDRFCIRAFCFDTAVYDVDINKNKIYGGGGTSFSIMERKILEIMNIEKINYPEAVFIITDGFGNYVNPKYPERWYWFLSEDYKMYIPQNSNIFLLADYE